MTDVIQKQAGRPFFFKVGTDSKKGVVGWKWTPF